MGRGQQGFTLLELMLALLILAVVTGQVMAMSSAQFRTYVSHERVLDAQEDSRLVTDAMLQDLRMAGFMVPAFAGIASVDGGAGAADMLCVSDPGAIGEAALATATARFDRAGLAANLGAGAGTVQLQATQMDIDGDGAGDFGVGGGIILSNGTRSHCGRITAIAAGSVDFVPPTPAGFAIGPTTARAVPAHVYELAGGTLTRNALSLSTLVEDVQVEFGVDADDDGQLGAGEFPIHDLNASDPSAILSVRLSVLARTAAGEPETMGPGRQAVANRAASGVADPFKRRLVSVTVTPPNLML
jgi:prepilin-type N-terminal cleavage/methylation domain-containing protein